MRLKNKANNFFSFIIDPYSNKLESFLKKNKFLTPIVGLMKFILEYLFYGLTTVTILGFPVFLCWIAEKISPQVNFDFVLLEILKTLFLFLILFCSYFLPKSYAKHRFISSLNNKKNLARKKWFLIVQFLLITTLMSWFLAKENRTIIVLDPKLANMPTENGIVMFLLLSISSTFGIFNAYLKDDNEDTQKSINSESIFYDDTYIG